MGNENLIQNTELPNEQLKDETETFNSFINVMVQIVENTERLFCRNWILLRRLRSLTYHISL